MPRGTGLNYDPSRWDVQTVDAPFELLKIRELFFDRQYVKKLQKEIEKLAFSHNINDMFSLRQTQDLFHFKDNPKFPMLSKFLQFLEDFKAILSAEKGVDFEPTVSVSSSKYCKGDFLLCHDDHIEDRYVAFIYYLNPIWKSEWGGSLDIFEHDAEGQPSRIVYNICPEFNSMIYFPVGNSTYHQVAEVVSDETPRITLNGWFHAKEALNIKSLPYHDKDTFIKTYDTGALMYLQHFINKDFLTQKSESLIRSTYKENNVIMLQEFLKPSIFKKISRELRSKCVRWKEKGPANRRRYDIAEEKSLPLTTRAFLGLVCSNAMCSYLEAISGKNLYKCNENGEEQRGSVHAEIQSWKKACYSLLHDTDEKHSNETLEMWLFFNVQKDTGIDADSEETQPGNIYYCSESSCTPDCEIEAVDNSVCWVRKRADQSIFVSYISATSKLTYQALRVCYKI